MLLEQAAELDHQEDQRAVDVYFQAAVATSGGLPGSTAEFAHRATLNAQAVWGLLDTGQRYGRLDPRRQLLVVEGGPRIVPVRHYGFAWRAVDFTRISAADDHTHHELAARFASPGWGAPLVVERISGSAERFFRPWQPFAATAVLRPAGGGAYVLEFYNPLVFDCIAWGQGVVPLAGDATAPLAATINEAPRQYLRAFTAPTDVSVQPQLVMSEPYQPGKIPLVLIHGLYSDPITWADMLNALRAQRDLYARYQFWLFRYPTGGNVLGSAAALRHSLYEARATFDPAHADPAFDQMVLVGHSLGGLLAKMQVTHSGDLLWRAAAEQPFDALRAPPALRERLAREFFYEPVPMVARVILIGTPHRGSGMSRRLVGRVATALVRFGDEEQVYRELMEQNRDVFRPDIQRRRPTTIQLLEPDNPFLLALERMPISCRVRLNTILGDSSRNPLAEPSDGVVPVSSAQHAGDSTLVVDEKHEYVHRHDDAIQEVSRILRWHASGAP